MFTTTYHARNFFLPYHKDKWIIIKKKNIHKKRPNPSKYPLCVERGANSVPETGTSMGKLYPIILSYPFFLQIAIHDVYRQLFGGYYHYIYFFSFMGGKSPVTHTTLSIFLLPPPTRIFSVTFSCNCTNSKITETSYSPLDILPNEIPLSLSLHRLCAAGINRLFKCVT